MCWQRHDQSHRFERAEGWLRQPRDRREPPTGAAPSGDLRVSDADRQAVIEDLRGHTADGRLTLDEFEQRVEEALRARNGRELRTVTRELPSLRPPTTSRGPRTHPYAVHPRILVGAAIVVFAVATGLWWVLIPLWFVVFGGCGGRRSHHVDRARRAQHDDASTYV